MTQYQPYYYPHFIGKDTGRERLSEIAQVQQLEVAELGFEPRQSGCKFVQLTSGAQVIQLRVTSTFCDYPMPSSYLLTCLSFSLKCKCLRGRGPYFIHLCIQHRTLLTDRLGNAFQLFLPCCHKINSFPIPWGPSLEI